MSPVCEFPPSIVLPEVEEGLTSPTDDIAAMMSGGSEARLNRKLGCSPSARTRRDVSMILSSGGDKQLIVDRNKKYDYMCDFTKTKLRGNGIER